MIKVLKLQTAIFAALLFVSTISNAQNKGKTSLPPSRFYTTQDLLDALQGAGQIGLSSNWFKPSNKVTSIDPKILSLDTLNAAKDLLFPKPEPLYTEYFATVQSSFAGFGYTANTLFSLNTTPYSFTFDGAFYGDNSNTKELQTNITAAQFNYKKVFITVSEINNYNSYTTSIPLSTITPKSNAYGLDRISIPISFFKDSTPALPDVFQVHIRFVK